jgi:hypothetical protein
MDDITTRLRRWTHDAHAAPASDLMDEAAAEIERLREAMSDNEPVAWAIVGAEDDAVLDSHIYHTEAVATRWANQHGDRVVPLYRSPTLTDEERTDLHMWIAECMRQCRNATDGNYWGAAERWSGRAETAKKMLERLK